MSDASVAAEKELDIEAEEIKELNKTHPSRGSEGLCYYCKYEKTCSGSGWYEVDGIEMQAFSRESCGGVTYAVSACGKLRDTRVHNYFRYDKERFNESSN